MKCKTCGMQDGNHDRACWEQQLHEQKMGIIKKLAGWKKEYAEDTTRQPAINSLCSTIIDKAITLVQEA